jgi:hypothetical protein
MSIGITFIVAISGVFQLFSSVFISKRIGNLNHKTIGS